MPLAAGNKIVPTLSQTQIRIVYSATDTDTVTDPVGAVHPCGAAQGSLGNHAPLTRIQHPGPEWGTSLRSRPPPGRDVYRRMERGRFRALRALCLILPVPEMSENLSKAGSGGLGASSRVEGPVVEQAAPPFGRTPSQFASTLRTSFPIAFPPIWAAIMSRTPASVNGYSFSTTTFSFFSTSIAASSSWTAGLLARQWKEAKARGVWALGSNPASNDAIVTKLPSSLTTLPAFIRANPSASPTQSITASRPLRVSSSSHFSLL
mmetsp:Transcript_32153/g.52226  ORF Transcript_32153/g.52226 Transcript_32153/m.52226 type:complete len:263 (+) Transcript_32153:79-867(+)